LIRSEKEEHFSFRLIHRSLGISGTRALAIFGIIVLVAVSGLYADFLNSQTPEKGPSTATTTVTVVSTVHNGAAPTVANYTFNAAKIYRATNQSIVTISGVLTVSSPFGGNQTGSVLGSGIVVDYQDSMYIVTNFHVVDSLVNMTVTFWDGNAYPAKTIGYDPYADLAVVTTEAPSFEFHPLNFATYQLQVGQTVLAIGNPFGLASSMTEGIISQLGRTLQEQSTGNFTIANIIQFSAPINPGNSGGPLLDANGNVIGITTAIEGGSQGVGFAIPSDTIIRELSSLITTGKYTQHPFLGIIGTDMSYDLAKAVGSNITYGVLIEQIFPGGPAAKAGIVGGNHQVVVDSQTYIIGGDVLISLNGTKIINYDAMASYLEAHTLPGQSVIVGIIRSGTEQNVTVVLGTRPQ
jgi:serine protease Do